MNYEQDRDAAGGADRIPAFLFVNDAIPVRDDVRIFEDPRRRFKCDTVFSAVDAILLLIPRETICIYKIVAHSAARFGSPGAGGTAVLSCVGADNTSGGQVEALSDRTLHQPKPKQTMKGDGLFYLW
jgi:hypothetical protein